jgi:hypothetical protein
MEWEYKLYPRDVYALTYLYVCLSEKQKQLIVGNGIVNIN